MMRNKKSNHVFTRKPLVVAVAAALAGPALVQAGNFVPTTPGVNQLPGEGKIASFTGAAPVPGTFTPGAVTTPTVGTVGAVPAGQSANAIQLNGPTSVIIWGGAGADINSVNGGSTGIAQPGGFNIGSKAQFYFANNTKAGAAVLNVDVSGATSVIAGKLTGAIDAGGVGGSYPDIFVTNANGIIVSGSAIITTGPLSATDAAAAAGKAVTTYPAGGLGLLGVEFDNAAQTAFHTTGPTGTGGRLDINFANAAPVRIDADAQINGGDGAQAGSVVANPVKGGTAYVLLAGADDKTSNTAGVSNSGTITTNQFAANAGTVVNSSGKGVQAYYAFNVDSNFVDLPTIDPLTKTPIFVNFSGYNPPTVAGSGFTPASQGNFVNNGKINDLGAWSTKSPAGAGTTEKTYITALNGITNGGAIAAGSGTIASSILLVGDDSVTNTGTLQAHDLTVGFGPGVATNGVGANIGGHIGKFSGGVNTINRVASINIAPLTIGGVVQQGDVIVSADGSTGGASGAPLTVWSDTGAIAADPASSAYNITGRNITISSAQQVIPLPGDAVTTANRASLGTSQQSGNITIAKNGSLTAGNVEIGGANVVGVSNPFGGATGQPYTGSSTNLPNLTVAGTITTTAPGQLVVAMTDPNANGQLTNNPDFIFNGNSIVGSGVAGQGGITANTYDIYARGSVNSPVSAKSTGKWLDNGLILTPVVISGNQPQVAISAISSAPQAINLAINSTGTTQVFSGVTTTPFAVPIVTTGTTPAGSPSPNARSSLIVQSTGPLLIRGSFGSNADAEGRFYQTGTFYFPGAVVFKSTATSGGIVAGNTMNAWNTTAIPGQGVFFEAGAITTGWVAMNGAGQMANYSVLPSANPVTYAYVLGNNGATVNFVPTHAAFLNTYSLIISGQATTNFTPFN